MRTAHVKHGGSVFAGTRDDPFFFDLPGFIEFKEQLLGGSTDLGDLLGGFTGMDTFAGHQRPLDRHQAAEQPSSAATGTRSASGRTTSVMSNGGWSQIDRMGRPAINTVFNGLLLPSASPYNGLEKDAFNFQRPTSDASTTTDNVTTVLNAIGNVLTANSATAYTAGEVSAIASVLLPDELTLTLDSGAPFASGSSLGTLALNGRGLVRRRDRRGVRLAHQLRDHDRRRRERERQDVRLVLPVPGLAALRPSGVRRPTGRRTPTRPRP